MGTGIVSVLFRSIPFSSPALCYLSIIFFALNAAIFGLAFITSFLRYTLYPEIWKVMIQDPTNSLFLATVPMGFATLIEMWVFTCVPHWGQWATSLAWALWMVDVVAAASVTLSLSFILCVQAFRQHHDDRVVSQAFLADSFHQDITAVYHFARQNHCPSAAPYCRHHCCSWRRRRDC